MDYMFLRVGEDPGRRSDRAMLETLASCVIT